MILYPAIDIKDGRCVRLVQGDMASATVFNNDPAAQARIFESLGFQWLHVVDLDGAFAGRPVNSDAVESILKAVRIPVQLGGGIRSLETVEHWLAQGVRRVVLGSAAAKDPALAGEACRAHPGRIAIGIDARKGHVAVDGWSGGTGITAPDLARRYAGSGAAAIIYTDIERDGLLGGLNLEATLALAELVDIPVIASGGAGSLGDIERLLAPEYARLDGVIIGRALYDGRIDPAEALALLAGRS